MTIDRTYIPGGHSILEGIISMERQRSNQFSKDKYLSHDLKNLLAAMIGYAEIIQICDKTSCVCKERVSKIISAGRQATELIDEHIPEKR